MTIYRERLTPGPWVFVASALILPATLLVFVPINAEVGIVVALAFYAAWCVGLIATSPVIEVNDTHFVAGKAKLPLANVGDALGFTHEEARNERGPVLDARAWLVIRGWVDPVVKVTVLDDRDPAPYWLVSTRQPAALVDALTAAAARR
jgi:hypothetical protein